MAVLNFFPVQKLIFDHFWYCKKWNLVKKNFAKVNNFIWRVFLVWPFSNFLAHCEVKKMLFFIFTEILIFWKFFFFLSDTRCLNDQTQTHERLQFVAKCVTSEDWRTLIFRLRRPRPTRPWPTFVWIAFLLVCSDLAIKI